MLNSLTKPDRARKEAGAIHSYNLLKLFASYSFMTGKSTNTITARLDNATDALYRNHLNYLKDFAPENGANFRVVYSVKF